jgi:hypothetical protein
MGCFIFMFLSHLIVFETTVETNPPLYSLILVFHDIHFYFYLIGWIQYEIKPLLQC